MALAPLPALFLAIKEDPSPGIELGDFLLKSSLGFGPFGSTFLLITSLTWFISGLYWTLGPQNNAKSRSFCVFFLLTMCGNIGLVAARDAISFYTFFAVMTFCAFSLIVHTGKDLARRAGRIYLIMAVVGEGLLIAGVMMAVFFSPSHYFTDIAPALARLPETHFVFLTLFAGFGIKAGLLLLHFWLPLAHPVAPTPASAVLSAAMIKAGLLGWMNFFPVGIASFGSWGSVFAVLGLGGAFFGVMAGLSEKDPKVILAYSSISQMGLMAFCFGLGIIDESLWIMAAPAMYLLIFNHALSKSALFLGTALARSDRAWPRKDVLIIIMLAVPALALAGAPFTGGAQAKLLLKEAAVSGPLNETFLFFLTISSVFTTLLMTHFMKQVISIKKKSESSLGQAMVWLMLIITILTLPLISHLLYQENRITWTDSGLLFSSAWPVIAGLIIYLFLRRQVERMSAMFRQILPDAALIMDKLWYHSNARIRQHGFLESSWGQMNFARFSERLLQRESTQRISRELELRLSAWSVFGIFFMLLIIIFSLFALWGM